VFDQAAEEAAIREAMAKGPAAYNIGDARAMAAIFDENSIVGFTGNVRTRAEREQRYRESFERNDNIHFEMEEELGIFFVTSDVAILRSRGEYTGGYDADGGALPPRKSLGAVLFVKSDGEWLVSAVFERPIEE
jgi:hypothetical protein